MKLCIAVSVLLVSTQTWAANSLSTKIHNQYSSMRALGMGNAFTAVADDYSLMFYNPAGFARKPYNEVQLSLVGAGVSAKTLTIAKDIQDAADTPGTDSQKAQAVSDALEKYYGQALGGKVQALELFWVRKHWGIGLVPMDLTVDMSVNRQVGPALDLNVKGDTMAAIGYGSSVNSELDAGITAKYIHRLSIDQSVSALELANNSNVLSKERFKEGTTFDFDLGLMWTPAWFGKKIVKKIEVVKEQKTATPAPVALPVETTDTPKQVTDTDLKEKTTEVEKPNQATEQAPPPNIDPNTDPNRTPQAEEQALADAAKTDTATATTPVTDAKTAVTPSADGTAPAPAATDAKVAPPIADVPMSETPAEPADVKKEETTTQETTEVVEEIYPLNFGLVVHNVLESGFSLSKQVNKDAIEAPSKLNRVIDVGVQYKIVNMEDFKIRLLLDARNILHPEITVQKATHIGVEFDYSPSGWFKTQLRGGMNQMYLTAGATLLLGILNLEVATYGEEVGTPSNKLENRVTAAKVGFNF